MTTDRSSRWSRRFVVCSAGYLVLWRLGAFIGISRRAEVILALFGFVLHMVFGMGYLLIPSYFERVLATNRTPAVQLGLSVLGTSLLTVVALWNVPPLVELIGATAWFLGVVFFIGTLFWTVRDNLTGGEAGTSAARASYQWVDQYANPFVPISLAYLAIGSYEILARVSILPGVTDGYFPRITHLLAAGFATLLVFALGVRLAPRFLGVPAPKSFVGIVLPAGALGPAFIAFGLGDPIVFVSGALAEATAVLGFAALYVILLVRSNRHRIGFVGVLGGVLSGVIGVALGLSFAFGSVTAVLIYAHLQLNLLGFLGLTIVGFAMQFFPPRSGRFWGANDRTAFLVILVLAGGLLVTVVGIIVGLPSVARFGDGLTLVGAIGYGYLIGRLMIDIGSRHARN